MKKVILCLLLLLLIAAGTGLYYIYVNLDYVVAMAIEKFGSQALHTPVRVGKVRIKATEGSAGIHQLTIANPQGFSTPYAFSLGEITTRIDFANSNGDKIVIDEIIIRAPDLSYEVNRERNTNFAMLQKNIASGHSVNSNDTEPSAKNLGPKLIIRKLALTEGSIHAKLVPLKNKEYQLKLPPVHMRNLGGQDGAPVEAIAQQILEKLLRHASAEIKSHGIGADLDKAKEKLKQHKQQLSDESKQKLEDKKQELLEKFKR